MKKQLLILFSVLYSFSHAQITNEGSPKSWEISKNKLETLKSIRLPEIDMRKIQAEDAVNDKLEAKPWRFGYKYNVNYGIENAGQWVETDNGDRIWRILFESKGALSLNFIFDEFYMPKGGSVYLYSDDKKDLLGAYTDIQNQENGRLGTWLVQGDKVWIEYFEPKEVRGQGKLNIETVTHAYRNRETYQKSLGSSGNCNHDVDCSIGDDWEQFKEHNKKAVALILINGNGHCTGTLINNTNQDKKPYFLTANHCLTSPTTNWAFRFGWVSSNVSCASNEVSSNSGPINMSISGATLRANTSNSDVALLELNSSIPDAWDRVWAGWDRSDVTPSFTVGIHHPSGDVMKIARDDNAPLKIAQNAGGSSPVAQTWDITGLTSSGNSGGVTGWEIGVTEGGSSGSALFDPQGRIIGQLYGGAAACAGTNDNNGHDYYGRFGVSWDAGSNAATRLIDWLDPQGSNPVTLNSFPSLVTQTLDSKIFTSVAKPSCSDENPKPKVTIRNLGSSTLTSLTINWNIDGGANNVINWTGSISSNQSEEIELPALDLSDGTHILNVSSSNPNGGIDGDTSNDVIANSFIFNAVSKFITSQVNLSLTTDNWSDETTWEFRNSSGALIASGGPYDGTTQDNTTFEESFNVQVDECYTFTINDSEGDGICCGFGTGSYTLTTSDGSIIFDGDGQFGSSESTNISVVNSLSNDEFLEANISIFPNPTTGVVQVKSSGLVSEMKYEVFNMLGQILKANDIKNETVNLSNLPSNVYFIRFTEVDTQRSLVKKIILNK